MKYAQINDTFTLNETNYTVEFISYDGDCYCRDDQGNLEILSYSKVSELLGDRDEKDAYVTIGDTYDDAFGRQEVTGFNQQKDGLYVETVNTQTGENEGELYYKVYITLKLDQLAYERKLEEIEAEYNAQ